MTAHRATAIRPARLTDVAAIEELVRTAYEHYVARLGQAPAPMTADYNAIVAEGRAWVAEAGLAIIGVVVVEYAPDHVLIDNVAVAPDQRGRGIGRELLAWAEDHARDVEVSEVRLYTNVGMTENLAYYPRRGYQETHRAVEDGYHRVFFRKQL